MAASLQLQILSDLHLESPSAYDVFEIEAECENLALLGDIGNIRDEGFFPFLTGLLNRFRLVLFVSGNHEPYHSDWSSAKKRLRAFQKQADDAAQLDTDLGRFVVLDRTRYDYSPSISILGCTLFSHVSADKSDYVSFGLNDFYHIAGWTVEDHVRAHQSDLNWLNAQVQSISREDSARRIVILTHHCPLSQGQVVDPRHRGSRILSGFCTDLSKEECWTNQNVVLWSFGHTHYNCDFVDEKSGKRVVCNQRGYYHDQAAGFDHCKVIEL